MTKRNIPVFGIHQHCPNADIHNFRVASLGSSACTAVEFEQNHRHEYFEIIWLKNGEGVHHVDMNEHYYNGSVIFFLAPGQVHKIEQHTKAEGYLLKFLPSVFKHEKDFLDSIFDSCLGDMVNSCPIIAIPEAMNDMFQELFFRFTQEYKERQEGSDIVLGSYLKILATYISRIKRANFSRQAIMQKPQYDLFRKFKIAIEQHYKAKHNVQAYADHLNVQARTLNTVAREYGNRSALELIQERIILEARRRLHHDSTSIKELGYELGFEDPAYFTRFFKRNVGTTPQYFKVYKREQFDEVNNLQFAVES